jgi:hypothetical protein
MGTEQEYLKEQMRETLRVIDTCLSCIYSGESHMYRALASQLRILLCDTYRKHDNSLIAAVYPKLEVSALRAIDWSSESSGYLTLIQSEQSTNRIAQMPFEITQYANGLSIADLLLDNSKLLPIGQWREQTVTHYPADLTIKEIVRSIADKGGGAHVDASLSPALRYMRRVTPVGQTYGQLFIVALARFAHCLGEKLFLYEGCRVSKELLSQAHNKYNLGIVAHHEWAEARDSS